MMAEARPGDGVDETIERLIELHEAHQRQATRTQKIANRVTAALGRPASLAIVLLLIAGWVAGNYVATRLGLTALEQFPFPDLALLATVAALAIALLILSTQRHEQELADKRAQLTLQIAMLSERKIAKLIALVEEQRRENPMLASRVDTEAEELARPVDPMLTLERIEATGADLR